MVESEFGEIAGLIQSGANLGFGRAANLGASAARAPWLVVSNADVVVPAGAIRQLIDVAEQHPEGALFGPELVGPEGERQESVWRFPQLSYAFLAALGVHLLGQGIGRWVVRGAGLYVHPTSQVDWVMGAFVLIRRRDYAAVGGFSDDQWMYAEDLDLCWRLRQREKQTFYSRGVRVTHVGGVSTEAAFGASSGTLEVLVAYYHWLLTRRGLPYMSAVLAVTIAGLVLRIGVYGLLEIVGRASGGRLASCRWLALNVKAARTCRRGTGAPETGRSCFATGV
jgi:GT2 family glycosyltransferase